MNKSCGWQGLGFGAPYDDAGCVNGMASDLDNCEHGPDGAMIYVGDETCPQCKGTGEVVDGERGAMALYRQRAREEAEELLMQIEDEDLRDELQVHIDGLFGLIRKLEEHSITHQTEEV